MVNKMLELLEDVDIKAYKLWAELRPLLASVVAEQDLRLLQRQIEDFDYAVAILTLRAIVEQHTELKH